MIFFTPSLSFLAATSYTTATWVIEAIAACNGIIDVEESCRIHRVQLEEQDQDQDQGQEQDKTFFDENADDRQFLVRDDLSGQVGFYGSIGNGAEQTDKPGPSVLVPTKPLRTFKIFMFQPATWGHSWNWQKWRIFFTTRNKY